jgi:hypothetical protein
VRDFFIRLIIKPPKTCEKTSLFESNSKVWPRGRGRAKNPTEVQKTPFYGATGSDSKNLKKKLELIKKPAFDKTLTLLSIND